jgi:Domain of unknown function (DUF4124)
MAGLWLGATGLWLPGVTAADIFQCVDATGNVLFTDSVCPPGMRTANITVALPACAGTDCGRGRQANADAERQQPPGDAQTPGPYESPSTEAPTPGAGTPDDLGDAAYPGYGVIGIPVRCTRNCSAHRRRPGSKDHDEHDDDHSGEHHRGTKDPDAQHEDRSAKQHHRGGEDSHGNDGAHSTGRTQPRNPQHGDASPPVNGGQHVRVADGQCQEAPDCPETI